MSASGTADSALAADDLLDGIDQSRIISLPPGGPKNVFDLCFGDRRGGFIFINVCFSSYRAISDHEKTRQNISG
jgi:hypothetical protein